MTRILPFRRRIALAALLLFSPLAYADSIQITLTQASISGPAGTSITFDATLTNLTTSPIFLNGDSATTSSSMLTVSDAPFLQNAPLSLAPGATSSPFAVFNVFLNPKTPVGTYSLNYFSILGGADGGAFKTVGSAEFTVVASPAPEPGTFVLLLSGALGFAFHKRRLWLR